MTTKDGVSFEKAFSELEKITETFEQGDLDLETGLAQFQRGLELAEICKKRLGEIENKIIDVKKKFHLE